MKITVFTIGFTGKTAEEFFDLLIQNQIKQVIDIRLKNSSQLAGFAKKEHLIYFLKKIANIEYLHLKYLAPTEEILKKYKETKNWQEYVREYVELLEERKVLDKIDRRMLKKPSCFLCTEKESSYCHRRLLCDYLNSHWGNILDVKHL